MYQFLDSLPHPPPPVPARPRRCRTEKLASSDRMGVPWTCLAWRKASRRRTCSCLLLPSSTGRCGSACSSRRPSLGPSPSAVSFFFFLVWRGRLRSPPTMGRSDGGRTHVFHVMVVRTLTTRLREEGSFVPIGAISDDQSLLPVL